MRGQFSTSRIAHEQSYGAVAGAWVSLASELSKEEHSLISIFFAQFLASNIFKKCHILECMPLCSFIPATSDRYMKKGPVLAQWPIPIARSPLQLPQNKRNTP